MSDPHSDLNARIDNLRSQTDARIESMRSDMTSQIDNLRSQTDARIDALSLREIKTILIVGAILIAGTVSAATTFLAILLR